MQCMNSFTEEISLLMNIIRHFRPSKCLVGNPLTHTVFLNDTNEVICQNVMLVTMLLNDRLKGIENSSLSSRCLVCLYSKINRSKVIACMLGFL